MTDEQTTGRIKELLSHLEKATDENNYIIVHPGVYKVIEDYNNKNALQKFLQNIKWGFDDCSDNFRNWKGHMRGEEWEFWEILSGEWSAYE